jgi:hypothetical protein
LAIDNSDELAKDQQEEAIELLNEVEHEVRKDAGFIDWEKVRGLLKGGNDINYNMVYLEQFDK